MYEYDSPQIVNEVLRQLSKKGESEQQGIPIGVSARHCHLDEQSLKKLFGEGYQLTKKKDLSQPGQFAANETVIISGPGGSIEKVRILGPLRKKTQVEVSQTDAIKLGLNPPIRESGNIVGSSPITIVGPKGSIYLEEGLILAQTHIHMHPNDAAAFHVHDGELVGVEIDNGQRAIRFEKVRIRISPNYILEMHIDTDEANAAYVKTGHHGKLIQLGSGL